MTDPNHAPARQTTQRRTTAYNGVKRMPAVPAYRTARRDRPTVGAGVARLAELLGHPLIPWQREFIDIAGEVDPKTARLAYQRVVMVVPRRAGKSLLMLAAGLDAGRRARGARAFYSSHRRETAAAMWRDDWFPTVEDSPLSRFIAIRRANGSEAFVWRDTRSTLRLLPPKGDAMRSFASHLAMIDEAREFTLGQGDAIEAGVFPTQATGAGGQTWIVSSSGDLDSEWLIRWRDRGREAVAEDRGKGTCYLEYAAPPGMDPEDPATWWAGHPGLGFHVLEDAIAADAEVMAPDTFAAEYLGWWPEVRVDAELVTAWAASEHPDATMAGSIVFAVEVAENRDRAVIVAAGHTGTGTPMVELVEDRPHGPWVGPRLAELALRHHPLAVVWDAGGPAAALKRELEDLTAVPVPIGTRDAAAAAGAFHDLVLAGQIAHRPDPTFTTAVSHGRRRTAGGSWLFDRRQQEALPLIAATLACWVLADRTRAAPVAR